MWHIYIVQCSDKSLYTGITTDLDRRIEEHNSSDLGAKYTRGRRPVKVVYSCELEDKIIACKEEYRIKKLSREEKIEMISSKAILEILKAEQEAKKGKLFKGDLDKLIKKLK